MIESVKFLHAADIHLDSPLQGLAHYEGAPIDQLRGATRRALENLIDLAIEQKVAFVLLAGDLYDGDWQDYNTGLFFTKQMLRLRDVGIEVFAVAGNHDAATEITKGLRLPDNVKMLATHSPEKVIIESVDVAICGQGFATRAVPKDLAAGYPLADPSLFNIGLLHTSLDGRPGHAVYAPCSVEGLRAKGYQYWALGHVHQSERVATDPWILFPGNTQGRHIREPGAKGCALVTVTDRQVTAVESCELDVVRWARCPVDVTDASTIEQSLDHVQAALDGQLVSAAGRLLAVRVELTGSCSAHQQLHADSQRLVAEVRAIAAAVGGDRLWIEKVKVNTRNSRPTLVTAAGEDALSGLLQMVKELASEPDRLASYADDFAELRGKLPPAYWQQSEPFDPTDVQQLAESLTTVEPLLLGRLLRAEDET